jgi:D-tyrosyl-tRNA(Tyr) deacylase
MRLILQRVTKASVCVEGNMLSRIGSGLLVFVGISPDDTPADAQYLAGKTARLRIFPDKAGKMNHSLQDISGEILAVSQFTLYGNCKKGNRPSFIEAARPEQGEPLFNAYVHALKALKLPVQTGQFGADMKISLLNDGPVTLLLESTGRLSS